MFSHFENMISINLREVTPTQNLNRILTNLHTILKTHIGIKMYAIKISFICGIFDPPTQSPAHAKLKKPKKQCLAPFWKPILVKMKNSLDITFIVRVSTLFVHKKLIYAYANDFHMIFIFHRIWNRDNLLIMTSSVKFRLQNQINVSQKIFSWSFVHI